jgi:hypothetical protein
MYFVNHKIKFSIIYEKLVRTQGIPQLPNTANDVIIIKMTIMMISQLKINLILTVWGI